MDSAEIPNLRQATPLDEAALIALQHAAYAPMAVIAGGTPLPLLADYAELLQTSEIWVIDSSGPFDGALILQHNAGVTLIWSIAVSPDTQSRGLGRQLLGFAEDRARAAGSAAMALYTNVKFTRNRDIYRQFGYADVGEERIGDNDPPWIILHMEKSLVVE